MCCIAAALCSVMFLLDHVDDVLLFFYHRWRFCARKKLNSPIYALRFVCITPSSILHKTVLDIK